MQRQLVLREFEVSKSYALVARKLKISRQRVHQIITGYRSPYRPPLQGKDRSREMVRVRDKHTCQDCGKKWQEGMRRFDVHHIDDSRGEKTQKYDSVGSLERLITLCHKCHMIREGKAGKLGKK